MSSQHHFILQVLNTLFLIADKHIILFPVISGYTGTEGAATSSWDFKVFSSFLTTDHHNSLLIIYHDLLFHLSRGLKQEMRNITGYFQEIIAKCPNCGQWHAKGKCRHWLAQQIQQKCTRKCCGHNILLGHGSDPLNILLYYYTLYMYYHILPPSCYFFLSAWALCHKTIQAWQFLQSKL